MNKYIGHQSQLCGVREARLSGGKADGMRTLEVYNASKLRFTVSLDRGGDIPYLFYDSKSMSYIAPCGMAAAAGQLDLLYDFVVAVFVGDYGWGERGVDP